MTVLEVIKSVYRHTQLCFLLVRKRQWHQQHAPVSERHYSMEEQSVRLLLGMMEVMPVRKEIFPGTQGMIIASLKGTFACDCQSAELSFLILDK